MRISQNVRPHIRANPWHLCLTLRRNPRNAARPSLSIILVTAPVVSLVRSVICPAVIGPFSRTTLAQRFLKKIGSVID